MIGGDEQHCVFLKPAVKRWWWWWLRLFKIPGSFLLFQFTEIPFIYSLFCITVSDCSGRHDCVWSQMLCVRSNRSKVGVRSCKMFVDVEVEVKQMSATRRINDALVWVLFAFLLVQSSSLKLTTDGVPLSHCRVMYMSSTPLANQRKTAFRDFHHRETLSIKPRSTIYILPLVS